MNKKFNKNAKVEKFTTMLGIAVRLIVIDPLNNSSKFLQFLAGLNILAKFYSIPCKDVGGVEITR